MPCFSFISVTIGASQRLIDERCLLLLDGAIILFRLIEILIKMNITLFLLIHLMALIFDRHLFIFIFCNSDILLPVR